MIVLLKYNTHGIINNKEIKHYTNQGLNGLLSSYFIPNYNSFTFNPHFHIYYHDTNSLTTYSNFKILKST